MGDGDAKAFSDLSKADRIGKPIPVVITVGSTGLVFDDGKRGDLRAYWMHIQP